MLLRIHSTLAEHATKLAFYIKNESFTYFDLEKRAAKIYAYLEENPPKNNMVALVTQDHIDTYAAILAIWSRGMAYVPLSPSYPLERNMEIISQIETDLVLCAADDGNVKIRLTTVNLKFMDSLPQVVKPLGATKVKPETLMSILFTSGSTGKPKGVPLTWGNIDSTMNAFFELGYPVDHSDRILQMFELTFDMSLFSFLLPWYTGASTYTVGTGNKRHLQAAKIMMEQKITFAAMVPSTLTFLSPYFSEINLPDVKYFMTGGEMLYQSLAERWYNRIPNAVFINGYGPCETSIWCSSMELSRDFTKNKKHKDGLAIGEMWSSTTAIIVDENDDLVSVGVEGELCLAGDNVMSGYWKNREKNKKVFFDKYINKKHQLFYRTGDRCFQDDEGMFYVVGRADLQYKIRGQKVELGELESLIKNNFGIENCYALVNQNENKVNEIYLTIGEDGLDKEEILQMLKENLPPYSVPSKIFTIKDFPLTISGKIDRNKLLEMCQ